MKNTTTYSHSPRRENQNVRDTSKDAFKDYNKTEKARTQTELIANTLNVMGEASRRMLEEKTGLRSGNITQCVKRLLTTKIAIELPEKKRCKITGREVYFLTIVKKEPA